MLRGVGRGWGSGRRQPLAWLCLTAKHFAPVYRLVEDTMCCAVTFLLLFGPRAAALIWALVDSARWQMTFENFIVPCLGFFFLPWTLLSYVLLAPGGVDGVEWVVIVVAFLVDIGSVSGGAYSNRKRIRRG
jgi:hypothetical protein